MYGDAVRVEAALFVGLEGVKSVLELDAAFEGDEELARGSLLVP